MSMNLRNRLVALAAALAALSLGQAASANVALDTFRTGGCSGCFNAQVTAALNTFSSLTRVTRGCATGGTIPNNNNCDGGLGTGGDLMDFVVLEGNLRNSNTDPNGLGVPGGATGVLYRISASGSSNGIRCANTTNPQPIGFLAAEGFDGIAGNGDDAWRAAASGSTARSAPPTTRARRSPTATRPSAAAGTSSRCRRGRSWRAASRSAAWCSGISTATCRSTTTASGWYPAARPRSGRAARTRRSTCRSSAIPATRTCRRRTSWRPTLNTQSFADSIVQGAQIFKFIVSTDVHAHGVATKKIALNDPQVETLFAAPAPRRSATGTIWVATPTRPTTT